MLRRALERERRARREAERIAEEATARLHTLNLELDAKVTEATQDLADREAELRVSHRKVKEALKLRDYFLASMTHELRSPLHSILGLSEVLLEDTFGELNERQKRSLDTIHSSGTHLLELINTVLEVSQLAAGKGEPVVEDVDLDVACREASEMVASVAASKRIELKLELGEVPTVRASNLHVRQILVNLLTNAIKFTPPGGRVVLHTTFKADDGSVHLTVTDTGIGISEEDFSKLFRPFSQLDAGPDRSSEGSGLGLLLVQRMADLYGGGVSVKSEVGGGSAFRVSLPVATESKRRPPESGNFKVVLIDDSSVNRAITRRFLERRFSQVLEAADGVAGVDLVRKARPSLIVLDLYMPKLDGFDVLQLLRADPELQSIPVAIISGVDTPENQERCLELGADAYFSKPLQVRRFDSWLDETLPTPGA